MVTGVREMSGKMLIPSRSLELKLKTLFLPYIFIALFCILSSSAIALYFVKDFDVAEDWLLFWLPGLLPVVPSLIYLLPGLLKMKPANGRSFGTFVIFAVIFIGFAGGFAASFVLSAAGKLTRLKHLNDIVSRPGSRYYTVEQTFTTSEFVGVFFRRQVSGKRSQNLDLQIFIATPMYDYADQPQPVKIGSIRNDIDSVALPDSSALNGSKPPRTYNTIPPILNLPKPYVFNCRYYSTSISNRLSHQETRDQMDAFYEASLSNAYQTNKREPQYYIQPRNNSRRAGYEIASKKVLYADTANRRSTMLEPVYTPFAERNGNKLYWFLGVFFGGIALWAVLILIPKVKEKYLREEAGE